MGNIKEENKSIIASALKNLPKDVLEKIVSSDNSLSFLLKDELRNKSDNHLSNNEENKNTLECIIHQIRDFLPFAWYHWNDEAIIQIHAHEAEHSEVFDCNIYSSEKEAREKIKTIQKHGLVPFGFTVEKMMREVASHFGMPVDIFERLTRKDRFVFLGAYYDAEYTGLESEISYVDMLTGYGGYFGGQRLSDIRGRIEKARKSRPYDRLGGDFDFFDFFRSRPFTVLDDSEVWEGDSQWMHGDMFKGKSMHDFFWWRRNLMEKIGYTDLSWLDEFEKKEKKEG